MHGSDLAGHLTGPYGGQRFVRHVAASAGWEPVPGGFEVQRTAVGQASAGAVAVQRWRTAGAASWTDDGRADRLLVVVRGTVDLEVEGRSNRLEAGGSAALPPSLRFTLGASDGAELWEVRSPS